MTKQDLIKRLESIQRRSINFGHSTADMIAEIDWLTHDIVQFMPDEAPEHNPDFLDDGTFVGTPRNENGWTA